MLEVKVNMYFPCCFPCHLAKGKTKEEEMKKRVEFHKERKKVSMSKIDVLAIYARKRKRVDCGLQTIRKKEKRRYPGHLIGVKNKKSLIQVIWLGSKRKKSLIHVHYIMKPFPCLFGHGERRNGTVRKKEGDRKWGFRDCCGNTISWDLGNSSKKKKVHNQATQLSF